MPSRQARLRRGHKAIRSILADNPDADTAQLMAGADLSEATVIRYVRDLKVTKSGGRPLPLGLRATESDEEFWGHAATAQQQRIHDRATTTMLPDKSHATEARRQAASRNRKTTDGKP